MWVSLWIPVDTWRALFIVSLLVNLVLLFLLSRR